MPFTMDRHTTVSKKLAIDTVRADADIGIAMDKRVFVVMVKSASSISLWRFLKSECIYTKHISPQMLIVTKAIISWASPAFFFTIVPARYTDVMPITTFALLSSRLALAVTAIFILPWLIPLYIASYVAKIRFGHSNATPIKIIGVSI